MESFRPIVISIAGVDPSAGAGLLADIKTFEQHKVYGLGISTAQTVQTENNFYSIRWEKEDDILQSIDILLSHYDIKAIKIGIVPGVDELASIVTFIHNKNIAIKIVIDTVLRSTSGFNFWKDTSNEGLFRETLKKAYLITPNFDEAGQLEPSLDPTEAAHKLSAYCHVLLKGGHNPAEPGVDYLFAGGNIHKLEAENVAVFAKHGSGCVFSASLTANLALGFELLPACKLAKKYTSQFLSGNPTLLGYHHV